MERHTKTDDLGDHGAFGDPGWLDRWLNVGTRMPEGPSFAFAAGSSKWMTDADRARVAFILDQLPVVDDQSSIDG